MISFLQVWRQIAVLHQTASQSQNILDKMELQTVTHINGTLKTLANMDGKVCFFTWQAIFRDVKRDSKASASVSNEKPPNPTLKHQQS